MVIHADADRAWVEGYLKPALGLEPNRSITPREFDPTATVPAEFERAVTASRFTLLVLSPAFLTDEWARFGEQLVSFTSVEAGQNRLLAVDRQACDLPLSLRFRVRLDFTDPDPARWKDEMVRLRGVLDRPAPVAQEVECPYPGMVPFRRQDARFFHGRDDEIQTLLTLVRQHRFLLVIGSSGSGKSSLVTAGLLPRLDDPKNYPAGTWRVLTMRPGATPLDELARTLGGKSDDPAAAVAALLDAEPPARRFLLVVDQFEELFSQVKDAATRDDFLGRLKSLRADSSCLVIVTVRADFYGDLMNSALWPVDKSQIVDIAPLHGDALRKAIVKPAEAAGVFLEEGLVEHLIADAADEPGPLPLLQEALVLLWGTMSGRLLTRAAYDSLSRDGRSGLAVAMATKADATLAGLLPENQRIARRIFLRLVQFGEGRPDTRRQLGMDDLRAATDAPGVCDEVLQLLIANRLLTPSADESRGLRVDIAHEMLIVGWPASQEWVRARRDAEKTRRRLAAKAEEWVRLGRGENGLLSRAELAEADGWIASADAAELGVDPDVQSLAKASRQAIAFLERRKRMWTRLVVGGLSTAILAISAIAVWGELERRAAEAARLDALKATGAALLSSAKASQAQMRAEKSADEAKANAAEVLMGAGSTALANGHTFDAMHRFAGAINTLPDSSAAHVEMRQGLGFLARTTPRLEAVVEHASAVATAAFSEDGTRVVTGSWDKTARIWRADTGALIAEFKGHNELLNTAVFSSDGTRVVTASDDKTARIWRADTGALVAELKGHTGDVLSALFSRDGTRVVTAATDYRARIWRADTGDLVAELKGHSDRVNSAAFSVDGSRVVTGSWDKTARIWRADTAALIAELKGHTEALTAAVFSRDGSRVVTASWDGTARIWRGDTGAPLAELKGHTGKVLSAAISVDGTRIVTASSDQTARIWRADTGALVAELRGHTREVHSAVFRGDGTRVITASQDQTARIWQADTGASVAELKGHAGWVNSATFSADGTRVVTASWDKTARVWRADTDVLAAALNGHIGKVRSAALSVDGTRIVTASEDKTARIWRADTGALVAELKGHTARHFRRVQRGRQLRRDRIGGQDGPNLACRHGRLDRCAQRTHRRGLFRPVQRGRQPRRDRIARQYGADLACRHGRPGRHAQGNQRRGHDRRVQQGGQPRCHCIRGRYRADHACRHGHPRRRAQRRHGGPPFRRVQQRRHPHPHRIVFLAPYLACRHGHSRRRAQGTFRLGYFRCVQRRRSPRRHHIARSDRAGLACRHRCLGRRAQGTRRCGDFRRVQRGWHPRRHGIGRPDGADLAH